MDKIGAGEVGGLQIGGRQCGKAEHGALQAGRLQIDRSVVSSAEFAFACRKHDAGKVRDGGGSLLAPGVPRLRPTTQDLGMMTDGRQRRTPAATQLPSILSEIAPRARLDMREFQKRVELWRLRHPPAVA